MIITKELAAKLIQTQFPHWKDLPVYPVAQSGWDNRTFHLGNTMSIRRPSAERYVAQVEKEQLWLPKLKPYITLPIPVPVAQGAPSAEYPWPWSVYEWIEGETASKENIRNMDAFVDALARFLRDLEAIDAADGPAAGPHNFFRGGSLSVYHQETIETLDHLKHTFDVSPLRGIWDKAIQSEWGKKSVWVHGDIAVGNLLVRDGQLAAVIDFGSSGTGDPACDLVIAWTFFDTERRERFKDSMGLDEDTWNRGRGWALWKALITYDNNPKDSASAVWAAETIRALTL